MPKDYRRYYVPHDDPRCRCRRSPRHAPTAHAPARPRQPSSRRPGPPALRRGPPPGAGRQPQTVRSSRAGHREASRVHARPLRHRRRRATVARGAAGRPARDPVPRRRVARRAKGPAPLAQAEENLRRENLNAVEEAEVLVQLMDAFGMDAGDAGALKVTDVARAFSVGVATVGSWCKAYQEGGPEALIPKPPSPPPGRSKAPDCRRCRRPHRPSPSAAALAARRQKWARLSRRLVHRWYGRPEPTKGKAGTPRRNLRKSRPLRWRAVQDSNLWPSAPEADALSS